MISQNFKVEIVKEVLSAWGESKPCIKKIYLFGSRLTGVSLKTGSAVRGDSDLDVAVDFDPLPCDEDCGTTWTAEAENWRNELVSLLGFSDGDEKYLDLQWFDPTDPTKTPRVAEYLKLGSEMIYSKK